MLFFLECADGCVSCTGNKNTCDSCKPNYVKIGSQCLPCNSPCENCTTDQDTCTSCIGGHYQVGNTCTQCPHPFSECNDENTPTECKTGTGRLGTADNCICGPGYFEKNTDDCG